VITHAHNRHWYALNERLTRLVLRLLPGISKLYFQLPPKHTQTMDYWQAKKCKVFANGGIEAASK
jgi:hypothetical protein